jgi:dipeptidyl aminopeptidase/acylaminoacyl peptidase
VARLYVLASSGGEAFVLTSGGEEIHAFAWAGDSNSLFFATRQHWSKEREEDYKNEWKDVIQYRESERGDVIWAVDIGGVQKHGPADLQKIGAQPQPALASVASLPDRVGQLAVSPDGKLLAVLTESRSGRGEALAPYAIYVTAARPNPQAPMRRVEHAQAVYESMAWAPDSRHIFFSFLNGSVEGPYQDAQPRVYWVDALGGPNAHSRWAAKFPGAVEDFTALADGSLLTAGRVGTEVQLYTQRDPAGEFAERPGWPGTYGQLSASLHSTRVAFVHSNLQKPPEVYIADSPAQLQLAKPITAFNRLLIEHELPQGKPYRWTADDGATVEGMLIYPPGKFEAKRLPLLTLIHGGPQGADGNHFEADRFQWSGLAATQGWLVLEPNYRGSIGYGDAFTLGIIPHIVSRPGKDILEGIDALVKDGIADADRLTIGGYSYGGYLTNWLITQTTRFKAAVTGAGVAEHVANWGIDDSPFDDAYELGGLPWQAEANYNAEAAIWQMDKVTTPTHIVAGADDTLVDVGENYLLERALHTRGVPATLLIFPGEGHGIGRNPWHGKIKIREELKWLEKYGGTGHSAAGTATVPH